MTSKSALIFATTAAIALASFEMRPAMAAPEGGPAIVKQNGGADEFSSQQRRRRGRVHPGAPIAAFGAVVGTIAGIAAAQRQRDAYERNYYYAEPQYVAPGYYYGQPQPYVYAQPQPYVRHHYAPHVGYDRFQRGPLQGEPGFAPSAPAQLYSNSGDGRL